MAQSQTARPIGAKVAAIATGEIGKKACSRKTAGKKGYFTSCSGSYGAPELWCADFARWVWWKAGALNTGPNTHTLNAAAGSFGKYGRVRRKPRVGDAVLFGYNRNDHTAAHVAIVIQVNPGGTIVSVGGDESGNGGGSNQLWASTSSVVMDGPYNGAHGSSDLGSPGYPHKLSGYVSPVEDDMPYTKKQIQNMVQKGVAAELHTKLDGSNITPAQGAEAAVHTQQALAQLARQVADLTDFVKHALAPATPEPGTGTAPSRTPGRRAGSRTPRSPTT